MRSTSLIAALLLLFVAGCDKEQSETKSEVVRPVRSLVIAPGGPDERRTFPGRVQSASRVDLAFQVPGQLIELNVNEGQPVNKNKVLARLDNRDYLSDHESAKARFAKAEGDYNRDKILFEKGHVAQAKLDISTDAT